jgi:capsular polysaccharide biosynthesis protein
MDNNREISLSMIARSWRTVIVFVVVFSAVAFFISTIVPAKYGSETDILILQKNINADAYQASKSSEFAGEVMKRVVGSSDFMGGVLSRVGENFVKYGENPEDQMKNWNKAVSVSTSGNAGVLKLEISDISKKEDRRMTEAIIGELLENGVKYHGNENITLKKIGGPVYFNDPIFPIIWLNIIIAAVAGFFFSIGLVFLFGERVIDWFTIRDDGYDVLGRGLSGGTFEYRRDSLS